MGASFWRYLFDSNWQQRRDIEELRDQLDIAQAQAAGGAGFHSDLSNASLRRQIHELSATVMVLVDMLAEAGALDRDKLRARVEGVLENAREETPAMPDPWRPADVDSTPARRSGDPYRDSLSAETKVQCASCGSTVPERLTVITATGVICDVCAAKRA